MGIGAYESIAQAGMPQPSMGNPNAVLTGAPEAEEGLHKRASELYNQIQEYHKIYGNGQQRMDYDTARKYHYLSNAFHEAMNQWEHYQNKNRNETNIIDPAENALGNDVERGKGLLPSPPGAKGKSSLKQRLQDASADIMPGR